MTFVVTTWNWRKTGKPRCETMEFSYAFRDMNKGETRVNHRYAITRIA